MVTDPRKMTLLSGIKFRVPVIAAYHFMLSIPTGRHRTKRPISANVSASKNIALIPENMITLKGSCLKRNQKRHYNFRGPHSSGVIGQNMQNTVFFNLP